MKIMTTAAMAYFVWISSWFGMLLVVFAVVTTHLVLHYPQK